MAKSDVEVLEKVVSLVALAQSEEDGEPTEEARTAAVTVARMMKDNDLVIVARSELEAAHKAINGATALRKAAQKAERDKFLWGIGGLLLGKGDVIKGIL